GRASASRCPGGPRPPYPRGPWLRSEFCCLGPSSLLRPHPPVLRAHGDFTVQPLIRRAFAVLERLGHPRDLPYFPCRAIHPSRRPYAGGSAAPSRCTGTAVPGFLVLSPSRHPRLPVSASNT